MNTTEFPWLAVYERLSRHLDAETVSDAIYHAHRVWELAGTKWTVSSLCWCGLRRVRAAAARLAMISPDSETVEVMAVDHSSPASSEGLDDPLSGLSGRELAIARAWSTGLDDVAAAADVGCSVRTVERARVTLSSRLARA